MYIGLHGDREDSDRVQIRCVKHSGRESTSFETFCIRGTESCLSRGKPVKWGGGLGGWFGCFAVLVRGGSGGGQNVALFLSRELQCVCCEKTFQ